MNSYIEEQLKYKKYILYWNSTTINQWKAFDNKLSMKNFIAKYSIYSYWIVQNY